MRHYYHLVRSVDPKIIGIKDDGTQAEITKSCFQDENLYEKIFNFLGSYDSWTRALQEPDFEVDLQCVKLRKSARVTDFLNFGPHLINCHFLVSNRAKTLFGKYNIQKHRFYNASIYTKDGKPLDYYLFFCMNLDDDVVDFGKSVIYTGLTKTAESVVQINSSQEYRALVEKSVKIVRFDKYVLNRKFDSTLDFINLNTELFVSEELRNAIVESGLTGVEFLPAFGSNTRRSKIEIDDPA